LALSSKEWFPVSVILPQPGQTLGARFRIERKLGQGGMGAVFLATDLKLQRTVALKLLSPESLEDPDTLSRFATEARAIGGIGNPHIGRLLDFHGQADPVPFLVLEFIEGESLRGLLGRESRLAVPRAVHIAQQMLSALAAAHAVGTIHRDIKPGNVMISHGDGRADFVRVVDFGVARVAESVTRKHQTAEGAIIGTPQYMAPEQAAGLPPHPGIDVYAVAVCLFEMLAGYNPFAVGPPILVFAAVRDTVPPALRLLRPDVSPALSDVVARALSKLPSGRFGTAAELSAALGSAMAAQAQGPYGAPPAATISDPNLGRAASQPSLPPSPSYPSLPPASTQGARFVPSLAPGQVPLTQPVVSAGRSTAPWVLLGAAALLLLSVAGAAGIVAFVHTRAAPAASMAVGSAPAGSAPPVVVSAPVAASTVAPPVAPATATASGSATPRMSTRPAASASVTPSASAPGARVAVPDEAGSCKCGRSGRLDVTLCAQKPSGTRCQCQSALGFACLESGPGGLCRTFMMLDQTEGGPCSGTLREGGQAGTKIVAGKWRCSSCDDGQKRYAGTYGASCVGYDPKTFERTTGQAVGCP